MNEAHEAEDMTCDYSVRWGTTAETTTRCAKEPGHADVEHEGPGLPQFPGQTVHWLAGDRREYRGGWPGYCAKLRGEPFNGGCTLPLGHQGRCAP